MPAARGRRVRRSRSRATSSPARCAAPSTRRMVNSTSSASTAGATTRRRTAVSTACATRGSRSATRSGSRSAPTAIRIEFAEPVRHCRWPAYFAQPVELRVCQPLRLAGVLRQSIRNRSATISSRTREIVRLDGGRAIFVEMPDARTRHAAAPASAPEVRRRPSFKTDLFPSILHLGDALRSRGPRQHPSPGSRPPSRCASPGNKQSDSRPTASGDPVEGSRTITVNAIGGLQYEQKVIDCIAWRGARHRPRQPGRDAPQPRDGEARQRRGGRHRLLRHAQRS